MTGSQVLYQLQAKGTADPMVGRGFEGIPQRSDALSGGTWVDMSTVVARSGDVITGIKLFGFLQSL